MPTVAWIASHRGKKTVTPVTLITDGFLLKHVRALFYLKENNKQELWCTYQSSSFTLRPIQQDRGGLIVDSCRMRDREHLDKTRTCLSAIRRLSTWKGEYSRQDRKLEKASAVDMIAFGVLPNLILSQFCLSLEGTKPEMTILIVTVHIQWKA